MQTLLPLRRHSSRFKKRWYLRDKMAKRFGETSEEFHFIMQASDDIRDTHRGEGKRKNEESRLVHERQIAGIADFNGINDPVVYIDAFTHDGPEDYRHKGWTFERIRQAYGTYGNMAATDVSHLTNLEKIDGESEHEYNLRLQDKWRRGGQRVVLVKSYDRMHGLLNPWPGGEIDMLKKANETQRYLIPLMVEFELNTYQITTAVSMLHRKYGLHRVP